jgi:subtilisin
MRRVVLVLGGIVALLVLCGPAVAATSGGPDGTAPYVVVFRSGVPDAATVTDDLQRQLGFGARFRYASAVKGFAANLSDAAVGRLRANPNVSFVTPDVRSTATGIVPLAAGETLPVGVRRVGAATSTQVHTSSGVGVAVLDTGIDLTNGDLNAVSAINCIKSGASAQDDNGHGTNVAGTIAAADQGSGVVGVAPGTRLYAVKVLDKTGSGTLSQILCGLNWLSAHAAALNIKVANMSLAGAGVNDNNCGTSNKDAEHQAICAATAAGVTIVASAGNAGKNLANYIPAGYPEMLTVTAMTDTDGLPGGLGKAAACDSHQSDDSYATYSNYALPTSPSDLAHVVAAPGTCVLSDGLGGRTSTYEGTSQSAPHVAGAVALCLDDGGVAGPCAGLSPAAIVAKIRADSQAAATSATGFRGDPLHPVSGKYFGYLVNAAGY